MLQFLVTSCSTTSGDVLVFENKIEMSSHIIIVKVSSQGEEIYRHLESFNQVDSNTLSGMVYSAEVLYVLKGDLGVNIDFALWNDDPNDGEVTTYCPNPNDPGINDGDKAIIRDVYNTCSTQTIEEYILKDSYYLLLANGDSDKGLDQYSVYLVHKLDIYKEDLPLENQEQSIQDVIQIYIDAIEYKNKEGNFKSYSPCVFCFIIYYALNKVILF